MRTIKCINKNWKFKKTQELPQTMPLDWDDISLPHTWNACDGQDGGNDYWRGVASYCHSFPIPKIPLNGRVYLEITGAANIAEVFLNTQKLYRHEGGYSTFRVDLTDFLKENNFLCMLIFLISPTT